MKWNYRVDAMDSGLQSYGNLELIVRTLALILILWQIMSDLDCKEK